MNKLNKLQKEILFSALDLFEEKTEEEIKSYGQDSFFAPGYWKMQVNELKEKLKLKIK